VTSNLSFGLFLHSSSDRYSHAKYMLYQVLQVANFSQTVPVAGLIAYLCRTWSCMNFNTKCITVHVNAISQAVARYMHLV